MNKIDAYAKSLLKSLIFGMAGTFLLLYLVTLPDMTPMRVIYLMSLFWIAFGAGEAYAKSN